MNTMKNILRILKIKSLKRNNSKYDLKFIVVDDNSKDGTREAVAQICQDISIQCTAGSYVLSGHSVCESQRENHRKAVQLLYFRVIDDSE